MARKQKYDYFETFIELSEFSCAAAEYLYDTIRDYHPDSLHDRVREIHIIENNADAKRHEIMEKLSREFITPIEREDIVDLIQGLDDVTDAIDDVMRRLYMFNVRTIRIETFAFAELVLKCCESLKRTMQKFDHFRKSKSIHEHIVEVNRIEEQGDRLHAEAMRALFTKQEDILEVVTYTKIFNALETCCDACETVANIVESVIMKNT